MRTDRTPCQRRWVERLAAVGLAAALLATSASAGVISNGVSGDGAFSVNVLDGGESRTGNLDPNGGAGSTDLVFDYFFYVDPGIDGGGTRLSDTTVTSSTTSTGPGEETSSGFFVGDLGQVINWIAVSSIAPGSSLFLTELTFTTAAPGFGDMRVIQYLDEDVLGFDDDILVEIGTPGVDGFQLLTVDDATNVGVSQSAQFSTVQGATFAGWSADEYSDLQDDIEGGGAGFSVGGTVDTSSLTPLADPRYPGNPAWGPEDITTAFAFDLDPNANSATILFSFGGSPDGAPTPPPALTPEPGSIALFGAGLTLAALLRKRAQSR